MGRRRKVYKAYLPVVAKFGLRQIAKSLTELSDWQKGLDISGRGRITAQLESTSKTCQDPVSPKPSQVPHSSAKIKPPDFAGYFFRLPTLDVCVSKNRTKRFGLVFAIRKSIRATAMQKVARHNSIQPCLKNGAKRH